MEDFALEKLLEEDSSALAEDSSEALEEDLLLREEEDFFLDEELSISAEEVASLEELFAAAEDFGVSPTLPSTVHSFTKFQMSETSFLEGI